MAHLWALVCQNLIKKNTQKENSSLKRSHCFYWDNTNHCFIVIAVLLSSQEPVLSPKSSMVIWWEGIFNSRVFTLGVQNACHFGRPRQYWVVRREKELITIITILVETFNVVGLSNYGKFNHHLTEFKETAWNNPCRSNITSTDYTVHKNVN